MMAITDFTVPGAAYDLGKLWFLVVDENPHMLRLLESMLRGLGVTRISAMRDAEAALVPENIGGVDIVLSDWMLAPISSEEFVRRIRARKPDQISFVPIIQMSGSTRISDVERLRDAGVTEFIGLPVSPKLLYERIVYAIEHPRPFIDAPGYFGPDRRRKTRKTYSGKDRRLNLPDPVDLSGGKTLTHDLAKAG